MLVEVKPKQEREDTAGFTEDYTAIELTDAEHRETGHHRPSPDHGDQAGFDKYVNSRHFVISSDAHQPNWLNQNVARHVCQVLGIRETILFPDARKDVLLMSGNSLNLRAA
jgi:hypothetical protein